MNKWMKIGWGILTIMPLIFLVTGMVLFGTAFFPLLQMAETTAKSGPPPTFMIGFFTGYILIIMAMALNYGMSFAYFIHLVRTQRIKADEKTVWACVFLVFHTIAMAVYWVMRVWPDPPASEEGRTGLPATEKTASRVKWDMGSLLRWISALIVISIILAAVILTLLWKYGPLNEALALYQKTRQRPEKAIALYEHALRRSPKSIRIKSRLARLQYDRKIREGYDAAIRLYEECLREGLRSYEVHFWLGCAYRHVGDNKSSLRNMDEAVRLRPMSYYAYLNRGLALERLGNTKGAMEDFNRCIGISECKAEAYINRGALYQRLGKPESALKDLDEALRADPQSRIAYNNRGNAQRSLGRYSDSLASFNEAIRLDPKYGIAYANRALTYEKLGKPDLARKDRETAARLPEAAKVYD